jgi:hypothetical protein
VAQPLTLTAGTPFPARASSGGLQYPALALLLGLQSTLPPELSFLLGAALLGVRLARRGLLRPVVPPMAWLPFVLAAAVGSLSALAWEPRDVLRDVWLIGAPVVLLVLGWDLAREPGAFRPLARAIVAGALVSSALHLGRALANAELLAVSRDLFRRETGGGSVLPTLALLLLFVPQRLGMEPLFRRRGFAALAVAVCLASQLASFSRTWWLALATALALFAAIRWGLVATGFALALGLVLALGFDTVALRGRLTSRVQAFGSEALVESLAPRHFTHERDLNTYWRSYESFRALESIEHSGSLALVVGQGLGARLDLGLYQFLDGEYRRTVPILHNGFLYLLLKCGLFGLAAHLAWLGSLALQHAAALRAPGAETRLAGFIGLVLLLVLFECGLFVGGAFNFRPAYPVLLVLGTTLRQSRRAGEDDG